MITRFVGDIHGSYPMLSVFDDGVRPTVQLGDFNLYGYKDWFTSTIHGTVTNSFDFKYPVHFVDGNHEAFPLLDTNSAEIQRVGKNLHYIPRGYVSGNVMFIGGADSIDKSLRTPGKDWFPEESISQRQFYRITDIQEYIEVIVSHEAPLDFIRTVMKPKRMPSSLVMNQIFEIFKPKLWIFGHHHRSINESFNDCRMVGLNSGEVVEIDVPVGEDLKIK